MSERKNCYYDVLGPSDRIYTQHFRSDGFRQDWLHFHSKYELTFVPAGIVELNDAGVISKVSRPHIRLHKPFCFHTANAEPAAVYECFVFYFSEESIKKIGLFFDLPKLFSESMQVIELDDEQLDCAKAFASMVLLNVSDKLLGLGLAGLLTMAEEGLAKSRSHSSDRPDDTDYILNVLTYINENISSKITSAELAKLTFVSEQKLCSDFKRRMNETLHHYIVSAKISNAAMLIAKGKAPLAASIELGFSDETHFAKTFKNRMGMTPYQFSKTVGRSLEYPEDFDSKNTKVSNNPPPILVK